MAIDDENTPPGAEGPVGDPQAVFGVHQSFYNLMHRIGIYGPKSIQASSALLNGIDRATGMSSKKQPF